jgi:hypothetical protein
MLTFILLQRLNKQNYLSIAFEFLFGYLHLYTLVHIHISIQKSQNNLYMSKHYINTLYGLYRLKYVIHFQKYKT